LNKEQDIIASIQNVLENDPKNYSKILELSAQLSEFDTENVRFSVDAGVISRLGRELVGKEETAVSELIKNAYDADALSVTVDFFECDRPGGRLNIDDNGLGMTRQQLVNGFMKISSSDKIHFPKSLRYQRTRAGQKGIGRFATQRLGDRLTIITQTLDEAFASKVTINWDDFAIDANLILIENKIEYVEKVKPEGTTLYIEGLREAWSEVTIKRAFRHVSDLLQPFPLSEHYEKSVDDPGFAASFSKDDQQVIDLQSAFYEHALAEIEGYVDADGHGFYAFKSEKLEMQEEVFLVGKKDRNDPFIELKNIHFKAYYFIYNAKGTNYLPKLVNTYIKENAEENGGIRLYRNGFRVLPYALKDDDWLGLDASVRRRSILPPHGNNNFFGFVEVVDTYGVMFQERSSREGLIENIAFRELQDFCYKVLSEVALKISVVRERKGTSNQKGWIGKSSKEIIDDAKKEVENLISATTGDNTSNTSESAEDEPKRIYHSVDNTLIIESLQKVEEFLEDAKSAQEEEAREHDQLLKEVQLLRILAGLGLTIGEFVHEINHYNPALKYDSELLVSLATTPKYKDAGVRLFSNLNALTVYTAYFQRAISENANRELKPVEIRDVAGDFITVIRPDLERSGIELGNPEFNGYKLFTLPMHKSEWASILFNLYTNSKKAIIRANRKGKISIRGGSSGKIIYLEFSDNGDGIPEKDYENIFDAFFTTSAPVGNATTEIEELTGTGLGLKIVNDIIEGYGGRVFVSPSPKEYSTTIRIELPKL
jgi:signal transduction histidine kinase